MRRGAGGRGGEEGRGLGDLGLCMQNSSCVDELETLILVICPSYKAEAIRERSDTWR